MKLRKIKTIRQTMLNTRRERGDRVGEKAEKG